ncbi:unnamed protein product, partial [Enterobius vermicularis]|uniref:Uncharacterized protein n=1 Tax=Enterobius vermicularis TaxID=51028 RepID=A0A0N4VKS5_ENTVE
MMHYLGLGKIPGTIYDRRPTEISVSKCTYEGKYGTADYVEPIPTSMILNGTLKLYVYLKTDPGRREVLNVIDLRVVQREKKPHRLAVCT